MKLGTGLCLLMSAALLMVGCGPGGPPTVPVSGTITKAGAPLANISITLVNPSKPDDTASGTSDAAGKFTLTYGTIGKKGAVPGTYKVVLSGGAMGGGDPASAYGPGKASGANSSSAPVVQTPYDKVWTSADTSPQTVEVKSGMGELEIKVE